MLKQTNITNKNLVPIFDKDNLDFELKSVVQPTKYVPILILMANRAYWSNSKT